MQSLCKLVRKLHGMEVWGRPAWFVYLWALKGSISSSFWGSLTAILLYSSLFFSITQDSFISYYVVFLYCLEKSLNIYTNSDCLWIPPKICDSTLLGWRQSNISTLHASYFFMISYSSITPDPAQHSFFEISQAFSWSPPAVLNELVNQNIMGTFSNASLKSRHVLTTGFLQSCKLIIWSKHK